MNIQELMKLANDAYYAEKYDEAINLYQQILERSPKNKQAQKQLAKAELNLSLKTTTPKVPIEALQLYKQSRSFITAGNLPQAKKLLKEAIAIAQQTGKKFPQAQELLDNLPNAFTADGFKQKALEQLNLKQWTNAVVNLETAVNLDKTDEANRTLLSHLQSLIRAQSLLSQLNAGIKDHKKQTATIAEIQKIIDTTNELAVLSPLWQELVRLFGERENKVKQRITIFRNALWSFIGVVLLAIGFLWALFVLPSTEQTVDCLEVEGLVVEINQPRYIANGDKETILLTLINTGSDTINGQILLNFNGTARVQFENKEANKIKFENLVPTEHKPVKIEFSLYEPFRFISDPGSFASFHLDLEGNNSFCTSKDFYIATSPIYGLRKFVIGLWGLIGVTLLGLLKEQTVKFLFPKKQT